MTEKFQAPEGAQVTDDMRNAVRWAPSSAYWSERLREFFGPDAREGIDALERQLSAALAAPAPQAPGMVMVPADPTPEMVMEGGEVLVPHTTEFLASLCEQAETVYRAMLAAAPQTKEPTNDR